MRPAPQEDPDCRCGHPQSWHAGGIGTCKHGCGCRIARLHGRCAGVEVLALVDAGDPPRRAPTYSVRCPECRRTYETTSYLREIVRRRRCRRCADDRKSAGKAGACATRPADLPAPEAFADRPHGTRVRYVSGCRCGDCREANNAYERMRAKLRRAGEGNELVDAARVRRHLVKLSRAGIGRRTVADIAGVAQSILTEVRGGRKRKVRRQTADRILAVTADAMHDAKLVDGARTWKRIARLLAHGFTKGAIALRLGRKTAALQIRRDRVTARTEAAVARLEREILS